MGIPNLFVEDDAQIIYIADSYDGKIYSLTLDSSEKLDISLKDSLFEVFPGIPDGGAMDNKGRLWNARWGGEHIIAFDTRSGRVVDKVQTPFLQPSSCCFGGPNFDHLFVTSAREGMTENELSLYPSSGGIMVKKISGTKGRLETTMESAFLC